MMKAVFLTFALTLAAGPAIGAELPAPCGVAPAAAAPPSASSAMDMPGMTMNKQELDEAHSALMAGMDEMDADMMQGGKAADIDVAFICAMIPHHRGAIAMARAELQHGDAPWARELAQKIIDAQEQEIADMEAWLDSQPN